MPQLLTLFARHEPTTDPICKQYLPPALLTKATDVQLYRDSACTQPAARYRFGMTRPTRSYKTVMHNCWRFALEWLPPLGVSPTNSPSPLSSDKPVQAAAGEKK